MMEVNKDTSICFHHSLRLLFILPIAVKPFGYSRKVFRL